jgi:hypothetical protein
LPAAGVGIGGVAAKGATFGGSWIVRGRANSVLSMTH